MVIEKSLLHYWTLLIKSSNLVVTHLEGSYLFVLLLLLYNYAVSLTMSIKVLYVVHFLNVNFMCMLKCCQKRLSNAMFYSVRRACCTWVTSFGICAWIWSGLVFIFLTYDKIITFNSEVCSWTKSFLASSLLVTTILYFILLLQRKTINTKY